MAAFAALPLLAQIGIGAAGLGTIMASASSLKQASDTRKIASANASNARKVAAYNNEMAQDSALAAEASSQMEAKEQLRQSRLKKARVLALAAASGGSALDQDVLDSIAGFEAEGDIASATSLYEGSDKARALRMQGEMGVWEGNSSANSILYEGASKASALRSQAAGTILSGTGSLYNKYNAWKN